MWGSLTMLKLSKRVNPRLQWYSRPVLTAALCCTVAGAVVLEESWRKIEYYSWHLVCKPNTLPDHLRSKPEEEDEFDDDDDDDDDEGELAFELTSSYPTRLQ